MMTSPNLCYIHAFHYPPCPASDGGIHSQKPEKVPFAADDSSFLLQRNPKGSRAGRIAGWGGGTEGASAPVARGRVTRGGGAKGVGRGRGGSRPPEP
uniref:Uncharacterized protein n=1 Tax=Arundo donax TaxID=35708 RepID=A0A0A9G5P1_ARUDO